MCQLADHNSSQPPAHTLAETSDPGVSVALKAPYPGKNKHTAGFQILSVTTLSSIFIYLPLIAFGGGSCAERLRALDHLANAPPPRPITEQRAPSISSAKLWKNKDFASLPGGLTALS